jgi:UDP-GlcNAc:undecaprenyl-phosphate/decaprenyl-phosphate GlcNAc-1-phosphate transferase
VPLFVAFVLCVGLTPLLGRVGLGVGLVDNPSTHGLKIHTDAKPLTGGISIVLSTFIGAAVAVDMVDRVDVAVLSVVLFMLAVGLADDIRTLPPLLRLAAQLAAGAMLAAGGATFAALDGLGPLAVLLAIPLLSNAVNIVDGQDGLAAGLALIAAGGIAAIAGTDGIVDPLAPALIGSLGAFLIWNRPPARVFMGDGGAYAVGCVLVVLATRSSESWESLLGTGVCFAVFGLEVMSTLVRRAVERSPVLSGDRAHVYDLLAERLNNRTRATVIMWAMAAMAALLGWVVAQAPLQVAIGITVGVVTASSVAVRGLWRSSSRESP